MCLSEVFRLFHDTLKKAYKTPRHAHHALKASDHGRVARLCEAAGREHVHLCGQAGRGPGPRRRAPRIAGARPGVAHGAVRVVDLSAQALHRQPACFFFLITSVAPTHVLHAPHAQL